MNSVAVVIPAYNEAATIRDLAERVLRHASTVIVVDDGSVDGTVQQLSGLPVTLIENGDNRGKGAALLAGLRRAYDGGADLVLTLDGDGQHRPEDIPRFVEMAGRHPSRIVIGSRIADKAAFPPARYRANRFADFWISWASGYLVRDSQSGFRLYPRAVVAFLINRSKSAQGFVFESEVLISAAWAGFRSTAVAIPALYGDAKRRPSHFRPVIDITKIVVMVAGKLLSRWMYPRGLIKVLRAYRTAKQNRRPQKGSQEEKVQPYSSPLP